VSKSINLVEYAIDDNNKLYETKSVLIETVFISSSLYDEIVKDYPLVKKSVFEEIKSEDNYSIECFDDSKIVEIISKLENLFISILENESKKIFSKNENIGSNQIATIQNDHIHLKDLEISIKRFRTITNVINIFQLKNNQYSSNASVVLKIG